MTGCACGNKAFAEVEWSVPGIESAGCAQKARLALEEIPAVRGVRVRMAAGTVMVSFDDALIGLPQLKEALNRAGLAAVLASRPSRPSLTEV